MNKIKMFAVQHEITSDGNNHHCMRTFHFIYMLYRMLSPKHAQTTLDIPSPDYPSYQQYSI
ncbi:hypothetical protein PV941_12720, partial [Ligilactobacillus salivarius]|nr:hypothetical protein [Ligilactobacillus salivarius]